MPEKPSFQAPTGTRDLYPADLNRLRFIQQAWRRTSINHGFEEIDGPTFEYADLYAVKSGEGILNEVFGVFSGKDPQERAKLAAGGQAPLALRPEFTPTLARMYAARANGLPKPTKWFWMQNCYRAERPQRGRLREFCQWNCDIIGLESTQPEAIARADAECIATCVGLLEGLGLTPGDVKIRVGSRKLVAAILLAIGVPLELHSSALSLLDSRGKQDRVMEDALARRLGFSFSEYDDMCSQISAVAFERNAWETPIFRKLNTLAQGHIDPSDIFFLLIESMRSGLNKWICVDLSITRGLAYYTGMVFEVHEATGAERAIAGGGRYDGLIELFGGPPTPAVGFGMGDVVLSLVLQDKGLLPSDDKIVEELGQRVDALVISNGTPEADGAVTGVIAALRRAGLHARRSYKATKNVGKLIQDAAKLRARFCVILESATNATLKNMDEQTQAAVPVSELVQAVKAGKR